VLARITTDQALARAVPRLQPEVLHTVITHCGLADCGELLTLATVEQLSAVFDLDLWKADRAGAEEQFDVERFCEWLEVLVDAGTAIAAQRLAQMDATLVVAGLSSQIRVFDTAVFSPDGDPSGADDAANALREGDLHVQIGGYFILARRPDAWDAILQTLLAMHEDHGNAFQRLMRECRRLSNAGWELDGLDDLLSDTGQMRFDLSLSREQRRDRLGFVTPQQARAFLESARHVPLAGEPPRNRSVFAAHERVVAAEVETALPAAEGNQQDAQQVDTAAVSGVIEILRVAGVIPESPRALLASAPDEQPVVNAALHDYLQLHSDDDAAWTMRNRELAFLANVVMSGCSMNGRAFTRREAADAVAATCNLGIECWPSQSPAASTHDLVTVFQVGWAVLHHEVSLAAADQLLATLKDVRTGDTDLQRGLYLLRRELRKQRRAGTPWQVRAHLDVLATLDLPAWAALTALFDECPVMLSNVAPRDRRPHTVDPAEFQFIADRRHLAAVRTFLAGLTALLVS
jgi:hypothetical protein